MLNVLMLAAGRGSRFGDSPLPKPFIQVKGDPMFIHALNSLQITNEHRNLFAFRSDHRGLVTQYQVGEVHYFQEVTSGAATTAYELIRHETDRLHEPWVIMDCDLVVHHGPIMFGEHSSILVEETAGTDVGASYSYIQGGQILCVAEKQIISNYRNVGVYHWATGELFCKSYERCQELNMTVNGEFYMAPLYNFAIQAGARVEPVVVDGFTAIGTPTGLRGYDANSSYFNR